MYVSWFIDTPVVGAAVSRYRVDAIDLADAETGITYAQAKKGAIFSGSAQKDADAK